MIMHRYKLMGGNWQSITRDELNVLHRELPVKVGLAMQMPDRPRCYDRDCGLLVALSFHCWGGYGKSFKGKGWTREYIEDYEFLFLKHLLRSVPRFDPSKGNWASQVGWAVKSALRDLARQIWREKEVLRELEALLNEPDQAESWELTEPSENEVEYV